MLKRLLLSVLFCITTIGAAFAADVEINKADLAALDGVKGIGPSLSKSIVDERKKGDFKDGPTSRSGSKASRKKGRRNCLRRDSGSTASR